MAEKDKTYRIGELARKAHVTVRTVRYYEALGLLKTQSRSDGGQRYYTDADLIYLLRILQLKRYGFSLEQIGNIVKMGPEDITGQKRRVELLKQYRIHISKMIKKRREIDELIGQLEWHVDQLESVGEGFQDCPGTACIDCQFKDGCEFYDPPTQK
ncbi:MAG: MerR family transcriptional regulator [Sphaerochaetaceae bacterium]